MKTTTLSIIKKFNPCPSGWNKLLKGLGKTSEDEEPLTYLKILEINGIDDALWAVRTASFPEIVDLACLYAESVVHLNSDPRVANAIKVARSNPTFEEAARAAWAEAAWAAEAAEAAARAAEGSLKADIFVKWAGGTA